MNIKRWKYRKGIAGHHVLYRWESENEGLQVRIVNREKSFKSDFPGSSKKYSAKYQVTIDINGTIRKNYKVLKDAKAYAKNWMKKHPNLQTSEQLC